MSKADQIDPEPVRTSCCLNFSQLGNIGHFLLGLAALIALFQASGVLEKVLEIKTAVEQIKAGVEELGKQRIAFQRVNLTSINDPVKRIEAFQSTTPPGNETLKKRDIYIPADKYEEALGVLKKDDIKEQNSFLTKNLKIWDK